MGPITAYLYVTTRCNARCVFCRMWKREEPVAPDLPEDLGIRLLADLRKLGVKHVDFTGGEPLLYRPLPRLLRYAQRLGLFTSTTTNGLLYQEQAHELSGLLYSLGFSLNGPRADVHDAVEGVASFDKVVASIQLARELGEPVHAHFTAANGSMDVLYPTLDLAQRLDVPLVVLPEFSYFGNSKLTDEHLRELKRAARHPNACINIASVQFQADGGNDVARPTCTAGQSSLAIGPDGSIILPCFHNSQQKIQTNGRLYDTYREAQARQSLDIPGRYQFCSGCTNWCYINPSFACKLNRYSLLHFGAAIRRLRLSKGSNELRRTASVLWRRLISRFSV